MKISLLTQARLLLIMALYSFIGIPLTPLWAQEGFSEGASSPAYTVVEGDTLWDIAAQELGDPLLWPRLWASTPSITNPDRIYPGDRFFLIPEAIPLVVPEVPIPKVPPPVEEVIPEVPIPEAPPPMEEVIPEAPSVMEKPPEVVEKPLFEKAPPEKPKAWYEEWWVLTAVGVVIAGVLTAIVLSNRDEDEDSTGSATIIAPEP